MDCSHSWKKALRIAMTARESAALLRALERVARGEPKARAARAEGLAESTVFRAFKRRRKEKEGKS